MNLFGRSASRDVAKNRLRNVLAHDRADTSPEFMEHLRADVVRIVSEYVEVGGQGIDLQLKSVEDHVALIANIPVKQLRRRARPSNN